MGGGGGGATETLVRYPDYMEEAHENYIESIEDLIEDRTGSSPYGAYVPAKIDEGYFGIIQGSYPDTYAPLNFPSLWDMFGKFIGDNDVETLWAQTYEAVIHGPEIQNAVAAQAENLKTDVEIHVYPAFLQGMRDINAIQSSAFIIGKTIIAETQVRQINEFAAKARLAALELSGKMWADHLKWSHDAVKLYSDLFKQYYVMRQDIDKLELEFADKHLQWDLELWDHMRAALGAMSGAGAAVGAKPSQAKSALAGALGGASTGFAMTGSPYGAAAGAVVGLAMSFMD